MGRQYSYSTLTWSGIGFIMASSFLGSPALANEWDSLRINGYFSFEVERQTTKNGPGDRNFSFDADLLDLVFNFQPTEKTRIAADVTWEHGSATEDMRGNVALEYGFVEYSVRDWLRFRAGKFLLPFGVYNEIHTSKPSFLSVKEASSTNKTERIVGNGFRFFPRWGTGIGARGDFMISGMESDYDLLISNGESETENPFEKDRDITKAITARVRIKPVDWLKLGPSFYWDKGLDPKFGSTTSLGFLADVDIGSINVPAEVVRGINETGSPGKMAKQHQFGWFLQIAYSISSWSLSPYARYEFVEPDLSVKDDRGWAYIIGFNWQLDEAIAIKIEDNIVNGQANAQGIPGNGYNEIKMALAVEF